MEHIISHTKPAFDMSEIESLMSVIQSRNVNENEQVDRLIDTVSRITGTAGGVSASTGTLGLHLALKALGVAAAHDEVIIPDFACRSLFDAVSMSGGTPVFCDINLDDYSLDIESVRNSVNSSTKAIILPHMYGCPADIDAFLGLGVPVIEDCAHSVGAIYKERAVGGIGTLSVFSFEGSKIISAGEGGLVLASDKRMAGRLEELRRGRRGGFAYHYRLSDLLASVALAQVGKLHDMIEKRRAVAGFYYEGLRGLRDSGFLRLPKTFADRKSVFYRFVVVCEQETSSLIDTINKKGILVRNPLPSGRLSDSFGRIRTNSVNAKKLVHNGLSLPIYPDLTEEEMNRVVDAVTSHSKVRCIR